VIVRRRRAAWVAGELRFAACAWQSRFLVIAGDLQRDEAILTAETQFAIDRVLLETVVVAVVVAFGVLRVQIQTPAGTADAEAAAQFT
jgi:hypothetical protein